MLLAIIDAQTPWGYYTLIWTLAHVNFTRRVERVFGFFGFVIYGLLGSVKPKTVFS